MLMTIEKCPGCDEEIDVHDAPAGLCPVCLMRRGAELTNTAGLALASTPSASPQFEPPDPLELEVDLPDFDVIELIGQGGMGAVYKARHRGLDRLVAIKVLPRRESADPQLAERFARESRALARLKHEQIVMAFDAGLTDRYSYFVMEYVEGPNLRQLLAGGALPPDRSIEIARDVCEALRYAHENGVVHRDIKPENVLIAPGGRAKLADFGLAKLRDPSDADFFLTATHQLMGTLHYMAPEQTESPQSADDRADLYSLGVLLYEMLTGELPLGVFDPPSSKCAVDRRVDEIVLKTLAKEPSRRFASAAELASALAEAASQSEPTSPIAEGPARQTGRRRRIPRRVLIAAGFASALAIAFWGWQFLLKYTKDSEGNVEMTISASGDTKAADKQSEADALRAKAEKAHVKHGLVEPLLIANCAHCHTDPHDLSHGLNYHPDLPPGEPTPEAKNHATPPKPRSEPAVPAKINGAIDLNGTSPHNYDASSADTAPSQGNWSNQMPRGSNGPWSAQALMPNDSYTLSGPIDSSSRKSNGNPAAGNSSTAANSREKPSKTRGASPAQQSVVTPTEINGRLDNEPEKPTEDLPIFLSNPVQEGVYPDKSLTVDYKVEADRIGGDRNYYLVIDGDHIGRHEMLIEADKFNRQGKLRVAKLPEAGDGEPLRIYIEVEKPALVRRVRASNIVNTGISIAGVPKGLIRYPNRLPFPAGAIHWENNSLEFESKGRWYELIEIDGVPESRIMELAKQIDPKKSREQFEEHLPELLERAGDKPGETVSLKVRSLAKHEEQVLRDIPFVNKLFNGGRDR